MTFVQDTREDPGARPRARDFCAKALSHGFLYSPPLSILYPSRILLLPILIFFCYDADRGIPIMKRGILAPLSQLVSFGSAQRV